MSIFKKILEFVMDILETVTFVGSLFIVVYLFIAQPHQVKGSSMDMTFENGQYILTNKLAYRFSDYTIGDVVVFDSPENPDIDFIKRIIALEGDRVLLENSRVFVNGELLPEPYIAVETTTFEGGYLIEGEEIIVPPGHLFVMGDNRPRSSDSRSFGPIKQTDIVGKVFYRYFPANKLGFVRNPHNQ